jgi:hypothetical protein
VVLECFTANFSIDLGDIGACRKLVVCFVPVAKYNRTYTAYAKLDNLWPDEKYLFPNSQSHLCWKFWEEGGGGELSHSMLVGSFWLKTLWLIHA